MSQPSLSVQIRDLEEEMGAPLFDRLGRTVELTQAGAVFLEHAERALREMEQAAQLLRNLHGAQRGKLVVGTVATVNSYLIPPLVSKFKHRFASIHLQVHSQPSADIVEGVLANRWDIGLCLLPISDDRLATVRLFEERLVLVTPADYPVCRARIPIQDLGELPLVLMPADYCLRKMVEAECAKARVETDVVLEMRSPEGILEAVESRAGLSILPELYVRGRLGSTRIRAVDLYDPIPRHWVGIADKHNRYQNLAAQEFGSLCRSIMEDLLRNRPGRARAVGAAVGKEGR